MALGEFGVPYETMQRLIKGYVDKGIKHTVRMPLEISNETKNFYETLIMILDDMNDRIKEIESRKPIATPADEESGWY
jgi:hypothetical protein